MLSRRHFMVGSLALGGGALAGWGKSLQDAGGLLPPWSRGLLDIHHIDTGRGNATFVLAPDGTTMLIDCGSSNDEAEVMAPARPNGSRAPGEWVARYALREARAADRNSLDYLLATHVHPDHVGDLSPAEARGAGASEVVLTGVSQVDHLMPAKTVIDRSYPDYGRLAPPRAPFAQNYLAWLADRRSRGQAVERARVGSATQIALRSATAFPEFRVRVLSANGDVWTGPGEASRSAFPDLATMPEALLPAENQCSIALRVDYGRFRYYTGGDLNADTRDGRAPWLDVERAVVEACGRVEVAQADHHGYYDACGPAFTRSLDAQAYVIPAWHLTHPGQEPLQRLLGAWPDASARDVFATEMVGANRLLNARFVGRMRSTQGHVVVRVSPGGERYSIFVVDSATEERRVLRQFGPYLSRTG